MQDRKLPQPTDLTNAAVSFLGVSLVWVFFVVWALFGMVPVLVLAVLLNHLISRLDVRLNG